MLPNRVEELAAEHRKLKSEVPTRVAASNAAALRHSLHTAGESCAERGGCARER
jgi:hypothetical protein